MKVHPCQSCGACCAAFRVSFYWRESEGIAPEWVESFHPHLSCMKGTNQKNPHCACLQGKVGEQVSCAIYEQRPSPCREFLASFEFGVQESRCDEVRQKKGLRPLTLEDWS